MFGKIVLLLLVTVYATQARFIHEEKSLVEDAINTINQLVHKIEDNIANAIHNLPNIVTNIEEKIKEIINKIDIIGLTNKIHDRVESILALAGLSLSAAQKCLDAERSEVEQLFNDATATIVECKKVADEKRDELAKEIVELEARAKDLIQEINSGVSKCFQESLNPITVVKCLGEHLHEVRPQVNALLAQIRSTVSAANSLTSTTISTVVKCTVKVNRLVIDGEKTIIQNFKQCVRDTKEQQEQEEEQEQDQEQVQEQEQIY